VKAILSCFATDAVVHDEEQEIRAKKLIEDWIATTIEKYKFQFKPLARATEMLNRLSLWKYPELFLAAQ
jgi:hypothetical protein